MRKPLEKILARLARRIIERHRPRIIGVTGSVGKTSAKDAIHTVLSARFRSRQSEKNYNNEFGLPLTVIGASSPGRSPLGWAMVIWRAWRLARRADPGYPEVLVLEMGVDAPGDMDHLLSIVRPEIAVVTALGQSHLENFGTEERLWAEKLKMLGDLPSGGWAVVNNDHAAAAAKESRRKVITYGLSEDSDLRATNLIFNLSAGNGALSGVSFKLEHDGSYVPIKLPAVIGYNSIYAALAAAAVAKAMGIDLVSVSQALIGFNSPRGRMNLVPGVKRTWLIDDTYNASPQSALSALEILAAVPLEHGRKWAVFGDMLELGSASVDGHRAVGVKCLEAGVDQLVAVGERARDIITGAVDAGFPKDRTYHFDHNDEAGRFIQDRLETDDLALIKGSQGARMEKVVKELMADPLRAPELLVRQDGKWLDA